MLQKIRDLIEEAERKKAEIYDELGSEAYHNSEEVKMLCDYIWAWNKAMRIIDEELKTLEKTINKMREIKY